MKKFDINDIEIDKQVLEGIIELNRKIAHKIKQQEEKMISKLKAMNNK